MRLVEELMDGEGERGIDAGTGSCCRGGLSGTGDTWISVVTQMLLKFLSSTISLSSSGGLLQIVVGFLM